MATTHRTAIVWFRRDLRLSDHQALNHAAAHADEVLPLYVLSTWKKQHDWTGPPRQKFLCGCLKALDANLRHHDSRLIVRSGPAVDVILKLVQETGADLVCYHRDPDPFGRAVESKLESKLAEIGVASKAFTDHVLHGPEEVLTKSGDPYRVYTPYSRNWLELDKPRPLSGEPDFKTPDKPTSEPLPDLSHWGLEDDGCDIVEPGERAAHKRMLDWINRPAALHGYADRRNIPAKPTTSRLSQDLRYGLVSIRELYQRCEEAMQEVPDSSARKSIHTFIKELAWREFYMAVLHHFPEVLDLEFNPDYRRLPWGTDEALLGKWQRGETGFPIVDAGMRELLATGFMHNRVRMITAMFLTKDLRIHWRLGESWFMQQLVDGEIASNNGGWQWSAGTGADAAPYFRIQNPWTQTKSYDPEATYIKRWIPELKDVTAGKLCQAPATRGERLAKDYPPPMVDHAVERQTTLQWFRDHKA